MMMTEEKQKTASAPLTSPKPADLLDDLDSQIVLKELTPQNTSFSLSEKSGFLQMTITENDSSVLYEKVRLVRLLPFQSPNEYISCIVEDKEGLNRAQVTEEKEIGIIRNLSVFDQEQQDLLLDQLDFRYYAPIIERIYSSREKMWFLFMTILVNDEKKEICITDLRHNIHRQNEKDAIITDIEGNKYLIPDYMSLDAKSRQLLDIYL